MAYGCVKGHLPLISLTNSDQVVSVAEIELSEDGSPLDGFKGGHDEWQRIFISYSDLI